MKENLAFLSQSESEGKNDFSFQGSFRGCVMSEFLPKLFHFDLKTLAFRIREEKP